jgi:hypothetical protein
MKHARNAMSLTVTPNFRDPLAVPLREYEPGDAFYEALIELHEGLSDEESAQVDARLVLLLANHIGDLGACRAAAGPTAGSPTRGSRA